jgi:hypothetical protein
MRSITALFLSTYALVACSSRETVPRITKPSFVAFQLRSVGTPDEASAPGTLSEATVSIDSCSRSNDNRTIVLNDFGDLHIENMTSGSTGCRFRLASFRMKGAAAELDFKPQPGMNPLEISTGNSASYSAAGGATVRVDVERGPSPSLELTETISLSFLPIFSPKPMAANVTSEDFQGQGEVPQLVIPRTDLQGILTEDGVLGYSIQLMCGVQLQGSRCGATDLFDLRFRLLDSAPATKDRQNLVDLVGDTQSQIIPRPSHLHGDRLVFAVTTRVQPGGSMTLLALGGDSVRLFTIALGTPKAKR